MNRFWLPATLVVVCLAFALSASATDYYVSPSGSDGGGDGSQGRPWRTIQKAADAMAAGDTCHIANGEYTEMVRPARSGSAGQYISFVADGSSVTLNGARQITGWTVHSGSIWKATVAWEFGELFVDRQRMILARWPNLSTGDIYRPNFIQATANGGKTSIIDSIHLTQTSGYWSGAKIYLLAGLGWSAEQLDVIGYDPEEHRITFGDNVFSQYYDADENSLYFMYDKLSLLDAPSEWFLDRTTGTVYVWLPDGSDPSDHLIEASGGSGGFDLTDRSYVRVAGFNLMSGDIKMRNATGCLVEEVRHLYPTTELWVNGSDNVITKSEIAYASYTGVRLAGTRNTLSKCHVHHCNYFGDNKAIVELGEKYFESWWRVDGGTQTTIADCSLHDTGQSGVIIVGALSISGCTIEHNEIYNAGLIAKDLGGFYCYSTNGGGTVIRYNIVHDVWPKESLEWGPIRLGYGIYLDENSSNFSVHHNVAYLTGGYAIMLHQASRNNLVYNNTAIGSGGGWGDVINSSPGGHYFGVDGTVVANNLAAMFDDRTWGGGWCINFVSEVPAYHHNGYYNLLHSDRLNSQGVEGTGVAGNPLFTNAAANDFSLLTGSPMIDRGAVIPGITDGYVGAAPDIGAYERGGSERPGPRYKVPGLPPVISLSRHTLNFGAIVNGVATKAQSVVISNKGGGTLAWNAASNQGWLTAAPASGTGTAVIQMSVNPAGLAAGSYTGTITVSDQKATNSPQTITVTLVVLAAGTNAIPFGFFETPFNGTTGITGAIPVTGWALDDVEVIGVDIKRVPVVGDPPAAIGPDGFVFIGHAIFVEGARPDVELDHPRNPFNSRAGWGYMLLTNFLPNGGNGTYVLYAFATDKEGHTVPLDAKTIICDNAHAIKPFGTIDTPSQGGDASRSTFVNFGWVLTPMPKTVPKNGSTIEVYVDSVKVGNLATAPNVYNQYRVDVATAFPGLNNTSGPVGAFYLDTTKYPNGVHTIYWIATDDQGAADGIGSRYFSIMNTGTTAQAPPTSVSQEITDSYETIMNLPVSFDPRKARRGFSLKIEPEVLQPDNYGTLHIEIKEVERIEVDLEKGRGYRGYLAVGEELRPLPIGSTFDQRNGTFSWMPGPGFIGTYDLLFLQTDEFGITIRIPAKVTIRPKFEKK